MQPRRQTAAIAHSVGWTMSPRAPTPLLAQAGRRPSIGPFDRVAGGRPVADLLAEQAADEFNSGTGGTPPLVEKRVELNNIDGSHQPGIVQHFHHQMRFAVGRTSWHCGADP